MGSYLPSSPSERGEMLSAIGLTSAGELYSGIPESIPLRAALPLPDGKSELEVDALFRALADKNKVFPSVFRGAGAYRHYIPSIVRNVTSKDEFVTAYTPYQPELSQGILQSIFEYQTMMCELTGMDVSNASVYDGGTAAAEALAMCREKTRTRALISSTSNPQNISVMKTYSNAFGAPYSFIPEINGVTDIDAFKAMLAPDVSCVYLELPNFYGIIEDISSFSEAAHAAGVKVIVGVNPVYLGIGQTPAELGADIAVGEGQQLGLPLSFGGPYLGFMTCKEQMQRKLPGRIVGQTLDTEGRRAFVLTLQAREQHIRREKASSNICSNQAHCALTAAVYLSATGSAGLEKVASLCHSKAEYLKESLLKLKGFSLPYGGETFCEFVTKCPCDDKKLASALEKHGILSGLPLGEGKMLWCATEVNTKEEIDALCGYIGKELGI